MSYMYLKKEYIIVINDSWLSFSNLIVSFKIRENKSKSLKSNFEICQ